MIIRPIHAAAVLLIGLAGSIGCHRMSVQGSALLGKPGDGEGLDCDWWFGECDGHPDRPLFPIGGDDARPLSEWARSRKWMDATPYVLREAENSSGPQPQFQLMAINEANRVRLKKVGVKGFVFAHIKADPNGPRDKRYGIGLPVDAALRLTEDFYIAVNDVDLSNMTPANNSYKVARWHVFGVNARTGAMVKLPNSGNFRWCQMDHDKRVRKLGSSFINCRAQVSIDSLAHLPALQAELHGRSLHKELLSELFPNSVTTLLTGDESRSRMTAARVQAALRRIFNEKNLLDQAAVTLLLSIFRDVDQYPAWMVCGTGCCTADDV